MLFFPRLHHNQLISPNVGGAKHELQTWRGGDTNFTFIFVAQTQMCRTLSSARSSRCFTIRAVLTNRGFLSAHTLI